MNLVEELSKYKLALQEDNFIASDGDNIIVDSVMVGI